MTRVLVWNLQTFGINKINNTNVGYAEGGGGLNNLDTSHWRRRLVYRTLQYAQPDIIILVEVASGDSYPNELATATGGIEGCSYLLNFLRTSGVYSAGDWRLVPPLRVGRAPGSKPETVAVFYRGRSTNALGQTINRYFTGPNCWTGGYAGMSVPYSVALARPYPGAGNGYPDLNALLVPPGSDARTVPLGALWNATRAENTLAARVRFRENNGGNPGNWLGYGIYRPPYMVTFTEKNATTNAMKNLTLFGVHSPAVAGDPGVFVDYLALTYEVSKPLGANETRMVGGDFNLPLLNADGSNPNTYQSLTNLGYNPLLYPNAPPPVLPADQEAYRGYFGTHLRNRSYTKVSRFLWSNAPGDSYYPGYRYLGSNRVPNFWSIDNLLVWTNVPPASYDTTIMNHVVGSPMNLRNPVPGNAPTGTLNLVDGFTNANSPFPQSPTAPVWQLGTSTNLVSWPNHGYILSTSDHFALYAVL